MVLPGHQNPGSYGAERAKRKKSASSIGGTPAAPPPGAQWDQVEPEHQGQRMLSREPIWGSTAFTMSAGLPIRHALLGTGLTPILLPPKSSPVNPSGVPDLTFMCVPV